MNKAIDLLNKVLNEIGTLLADGKARTVADITAGIPSGKLVTDDNVSSVLTLLEAVKAVKRDADGKYVGI